MLDIELNVPAYNLRNMRFLDKKLAYNCLMSLPAFDTFGEILKFLRRRARLTQKDLSIAVGYSESHISRLEGNERPPDPATLAALFVPALRLEKEPELVSRMMELAEAARGESALRPEKPPSAPPNNLPLHLTSFVGRTREIFEGVQLSSEYRLVTLTGAGGCGKTRLALRIAEDVLPAYPDGVWFVEFAPLGVPALIPQTIATVVGVQEMRDRPVAMVLREFLRPRRLLLILDNCEHLVADIAVLVETLLLTCPGLHILATSRETLNIAGEITFRVPPLRLPSLGWVHSLERVAEAEAVKLFVERARAGLPSFTLTEENAAAVAQICARLDGIPLAIELAAARVRLMQVEQIAARLDDRFALLTTGPRSFPERHRTLQALMDWSYSLLEQPEQALLNRLSVFAGSFTLEAAEAISGEPETVDLLARLVDKSLVIAENLAGGMRYRLLETVRQYAQVRLHEVGAEKNTREWHARFYLALAEQAEPKILSSERVRTIQQVDREYDDVRCALDWVRTFGDAQLALRLVNALIWFWHFRGYISEGRTLIEGMIQAYEGQIEDHRAKMALGKALWGAGIFAWIQGEFANAHKWFTASVAVLRDSASLGEPENWRNLAHALSNLGLVLLDEGDLSQAHSLTEEAVGLARQWGTPWDLALLLYNFGEVTYAQGNEASARPLLMESQRLFRQLGDPWGMSIPSFLFGLIAGDKGDYADALVHFNEALQLQRAEGDLWGSVEAMLLSGQAAHQMGDFHQAAARYEESLRLNAERVGDIGIIIRTLYSLAHLAWAQGEPARAAKLLGAYTALRETTGSPIRRSILNRDDEQTVASLQELMGEDHFKTAWAEGITITLEQAIEMALR
ncbi:MAG: tetratricopeptide repeat protein [Anaerolineales bacterium]